MFVLKVGADGGKSRVRELAGFKTTGWNYSQNAIICTVEHTSANHCAWQRFLPNGPIALLPMGDNFSNIVWTMSPTESNDRKSITEEMFLKDMNSALDYGYGPHPTSSSLGARDIFSWLKMDGTLSANEPFEIPPKAIRLASERMVFPLSLRHANSYASKRVVLIGDAAHTIHPLAGQGVNLGFGDAYSLSRVIAEGIALGSDIGEVCYDSDNYIMVFIILKTSELLWESILEVYVMSPMLLSRCLGLLLTYVWELDFGGEGCRRPSLYLDIYLMRF